MFKSLSLLVLISSALFSSPLQEAINKADEGSIIRLNPGVYEGNLIINKAITIEGKEDGVVLKGSGKGTVVKITSSYVTLKNLRITHSGQRHDQLDGAISIVEAKNCEISKVHIDDTLFGIDLQSVSNSKITDNYITSQDAPIGLRGDGIRLWYSNDNLIKNNTLFKSEIWWCGTHITIIFLIIQQNTVVIPCILCTQVKIM